MTQQGFGLISGNWVNFRYQDRLAIGGQGGAFHYQVSAQIALGMIYRIFADHGVVLRLGLLLDWQKNHALRNLDLSIPELHLGWSGIQKALQFELAGTFSPFWLRRYQSNLSSARQHLQRMSVGAIATLVYRRFRLSTRADWSVIHAKARPRVAADLCVHFVKRPPKPGLALPQLVKSKTWFGPNEQRYRAGICANARVNAQHPGLGTARSQRIALSIMWGKISFLDPMK